MSKPVIQCPPINPVEVDGNYDDLEFWPRFGGSRCSNEDKKYRGNPRTVTITCTQSDSDAAITESREYFLGDYEDIYEITAVVMCEENRICVDGVERYDKDGYPLELAFCVSKKMYGLWNFVLLALEKNRTSELSSQVSNQSSLNYYGSLSEALRNSNLSYYKTGEEAYPPWWPPSLIQKFLYYLGEPTSNYSGSSIESLRELNFSDYESEIGGEVQIPSHPLPFNYSGSPSESSRESRLSNHKST